MLVLYYCRAHHYKPWLKQCTLSHGFCRSGSQEQSSCVSLAQLKSSLLGQGLTGAIGSGLSSLKWYVAGSLLSLLVVSRILQLLTTRTIPQGSLNLPWMWQLASTRTSDMKDRARWKLSCMTHTWKLHAIVLTAFCLLEVTHSVQPYSRGGN